MHLGLSAIFHARINLVNTNHRHEFNQDSYDTWKRRILISETIYTTGLIIKPEYNSYDCHTVLNTATN